MKNIKQSFYSLALIVLAIVIAIGVNIAFAAWSGPTQNPPQGNAPAPLNTSSNTQTLQGSKIISGNQLTDILTLGLGTAINGILGVNGITQFFSTPISAIFDGKVGIGTTAPGEKLDVNGSIKATGRIKIGDNVDTPTAGTIRWSGTDFEGYTGIAWKSLTSKDGAPATGACASSGSQQFTTIGESSFIVDDSMKNCLFIITLKGAGGYNNYFYSYRIGKGGKGGGTVFNYKPQSTGTFGVYIGEGANNVNHGKKPLGGGSSSLGACGGYCGGGGGASAVKFNSTILAVAGGGGGSSDTNQYYGGNGGGGNSPGENGIGGSIGGANGIGGGGTGGNAGKNGITDDLGGIGIPAYNIGGGGNNGSASGGGGGYGGGASGWVYSYPVGGGSGAGGYEETSMSGGAGGGGFINVGKVESYTIVEGADSEKDGSALIEWR